MTTTDIIRQAIYYLRKAYSLIASLVLLPALGLLAQRYFVERAKGPSAYTIYVGGTAAVGQSEESSTQTIIDALKAAHVPTFGGIPVQVESRATDDDPESSVFAAQELARRPDTLLVVCNLGSTATKAAMPAYLNAIPPIPVILTGQTNPDLVPEKLLERPSRLRCAATATDPHFL
jgi:ABC-type branched-subunit amino acid transport system substrate-binding protein